VVESNGNNNTFGDLHMAIYDCIQNWMQQQNASKYPFYMLWRRSVFSGLTKWDDWTRCARVLKLSSLRDYIDFVQQCPLVRNTFDLVWDRSNEAIHYREYNLNQPNDITENANKLQRFQQQLRTVSNSFERAFYNLEQRLHDTQNRLGACKQGILTKLTSTTSTLATNVAEHVRQLKAVATTTTDQVRKQVAQITEEGVDGYRSRIAITLAKVDTRQAQFDEAFEQRLEAAIEKAVQEIHTTADEATANLNKQAQIVLQQFQEDTKTNNNFVSPIPDVA